MIKSFSFSTPNYRERQQRQAELAKLSGIEITQYTEADLPDWLNEYAKENPRGYGFWRWKPWLTIHHADKCEVDDIIVYVDCGDRIDPMFWPFLEQYMFNNDVLLVNRGYSHFQWTKPECLEAFGVVEDCLQLEAGVYAFKKHEYCPTLYGVNYMLDLWNGYSMRTPKLFDDSTSMRNVFIDHRHDQSVLTCIAQRLGFTNKSINLDHLIKWNQQH